MTRASLDKDPAEVAAMFDEVAPRYDLTNSLLVKLSKAMLGIDTGRVKRNLLAINEER